MAAWVAPAIVAGASILGGLMSSSASSSASKRASQDTRYAADIQKQIYDQNRADQMPFYNVGVQSLYDMAGYSPVGASPTPYQTTPAYPSVNLNAGGLPGATPGTSAALTAAGPVMGAAQNLISGVQSGTANTAPASPMDWDQYSRQAVASGNIPAWMKWDQKYSDPSQDPNYKKNWGFSSPEELYKARMALEMPLNNQYAQQGVGGDASGMVKTGPGLDPTGGAGQYMEQLENLAQNFQFDPENPNYKIQLEDTERAINQAYAARGMYNSRPAVNTIADNARRLSAAESERQYAKQYSNLFDLFNMSTNLGQLNYGKAIDLVKAGQGAAGAMGQSGLAYGQGVASTYGDLASINMAEGANQSALWSGLGAMPLNYMMLQNMFGGQQTPQTGNPYMAPQ